LAKILGVTRRTLQNWRKRRDATPPAANGFHEVSAREQFMGCSKAPNSGEFGYGVC
jgi:hypothetical protein